MKILIKCLFVELTIARQIINLRSLRGIHDLFIKKSSSICDFVIEHTCDLIGLIESWRTGGKSDQNTHWSTLFCSSGIYRALSVLHLKQTGGASVIVHESTSRRLNKPANHHLNTWTLPFLLDLFRNNSNLQTSFFNFK